MENVIIFLGFGIILTMMGFLGLLLLNTIYNEIKDIIKG